jgi:hypothetical protein
MLAARIELLKITTNIIPSTRRGLLTIDHQIASNSANPNFDTLKRKLKNLRSLSLMR